MLGKQRWISHGASLWGVYAFMKEIDMKKSDDTWYLQHLETTKRQGMLEWKEMRIHKLVGRRWSLRRLRKGSEDWTRLWRSRLSRDSLGRDPLGREEKCISDKGHGIFHGKSDWKLILETYEEFISHLLFWIYLNTFFSKWQEDTRWHQRALTRSSSPLNVPSCLEVGTKEAGRK